MKKIIILAFLLFWGCQNKNSFLENKRPLRRIALVIGNQDYGENALENPINDANGVYRV